MKKQDETEKKVEDNAPIADTTDEELPRKQSRSAMRRARTYRLVCIAVAVAMITVGAFVKIPLGIGAVPISLQCSFCVLCGLLLGAKDGMIAVVVYLAMGLAGVPIFTAGGGLGYVFQPTFGYLLAYLVAVPVGALVARGVHNTTSPKLWRLVLGAVVCLAIVYIGGVMYMYGIMRWYLGNPIDMGKAWLTGCAVFLPTDCGLCTIAAIVAYKVVPKIAPALGAERAAKLQADGNKG